MVALTVNLSRGNSNQLAEAVLLDLEQRHVDDFQTDWVASLRQSAQDDKYWDWVFKQRAATNYGNYECYAIEAEGRTQGLMMIETLWHRSQVAVSAFSLRRGAVGRALEPATDTAATILQAGRVSAPRVLSDKK